MKTSKAISALAAIIILVSNGALPAYAQGVSSKAATPAGEFHINAVIESVIDYTLTEVYYNGQPGGTYTKTKTYYKNINVPTGSHLVQTGTRTVVDFNSAFPSGNAGDLKSRTHVYYDYKTVLD